MQPGCAVVSVHIEGPSITVCIIANQFAAAEVDMARLHKYGTCRAANNTTSEKPQALVGDAATNTDVSGYMHACIHEVCSRCIRAMCNIQ